MKTVAFTETNKRSITKSITFRTLIVVADLVIVYALTHHVGTTIAVTVLTNISSTIFYFLHERMWNGISWGRRKTR